MAYRYKGSPFMVASGIDRSTTVLELADWCTALATLVDELTDKVDELEGEIDQLKRR